MIFRQSLIQAPDAVYSNRLSYAGGASGARNLSWMWLLVIWMIALIPRAVMALRGGAICDDAFYYIYIGKTLEQHDFITAFGYLNLNVYPLILLFLHKMGLDWVVAGKFWGVLISSLTVLPLFGWVRRLYSDQIAACASFLFAIHPELIEVSIEPIRGPTFWFFLNLGFYLMWRSTTEMKLRLFLFSGIALTLAIHTRTEGWILVFPIVWWVFWQIKQTPARRKKLATGLAACLLTIPLMLLLVNVTLLKSYPQWEWGRLNHFQACWEWTESTLGIGEIEPVTHSSNRAQNIAAGNQSPDVKQSGDIAPISTTEVSTSTTAIPTAFSDGRIEKYVKRLFRTMEPINLVFLFTGLIGWRSTIFKRDKLIFILISLLMLLGVWIRLTQFGDMNGRYFFPMYFSLLPFSAIGCLWFWNKMERMGQRFLVQHHLRVIWVAGLMYVLCGIHLTDALTAHHRHREVQDGLGRWLQQTYGPLDSVVVNLSALRVGYSALDSDPLISDTFFTHREFRNMGRPQVVILATRDAPPGYEQHLQRKIDAWKWVQIPVEDLPVGSNGFLVLLDPAFYSSVSEKKRERTALAPVEKH